MPMDAWREGDTFVIEFDLPGVRPETLDIDVERNVLTVRAERPRRSGDWEMLAAERPTGLFSRQLVLGDNLDLDRFEAAYDDGVLRLRVPVAEKAKPRSIEVTTGVPRAQDQTRDLAPDRRARVTRRAGARASPGRRSPRGQPDRGVRRELDRPVAQDRRRAGDVVDHGGRVQAEVVEHRERHVPRGRASRCRRRASAQRVPARDQQHARVAGVEHRRRRPTACRCGSAARAPDQVPDAGLDAVLVGRQRPGHPRAGAPTGCPRRARARRPSRGR